MFTVYTKFWPRTPHAYLAWFWYWLSHTSVLYRLIVIYWEIKTLKIKRFRIWICKVTVDLLNIHLCVSICNIIFLFPPLSFNLLNTCWWFMWFKFYYPFVLIFFWPLYCLSFSDLRLLVCNMVKGILNWKKICKKNIMTTYKHECRSINDILLNWFYRLITYVKLLIYILWNVKIMYALLNRKQNLNKHGIHWVMDK